MKTAYRSYAAQTAHYFDRPHDGVPLEPIEGPAAWRPQTAGAWKLAFDETEIAQLEAGVEAARASGKPVAEWAASDVSWPALSDSLVRWRAILREGRGFVVLSGLPVARWGRGFSEAFFWALGLHLGTPGAQNPQGDLLGHVTDTGADRQDPQVRLYKTSAEIAYHCDAADAVGLLCLSAPGAGGRSRLASSVTIWNTLLAERPRLAARLFDPVQLDLRNEGREGMPGAIEVVPCRFHAGQLRTFYHSDYFRSVARLPDARPFSPEESALFDAFDEIATRPDVQLEMDLAPGDLQLVSNHTIVHARSRYRDDGAAKRHLLRLWLSL